jgi:nucleotide-binding universal stress UspA family protein
MFEKILLAIDGSEPTTRAVHAAGELARASRGEVHVLHVNEYGLQVGGPYDFETIEEASHIVEDAVIALKDAGVSALGETRRASVGRVPRVIVDVGKEVDAGTIVLGSRGLSDWGGVFLGSVTHRVLHIAEVPVLVVR